MINKSIN